MLHCRSYGCLLALCVLGASTALAQEACETPIRPYDGIQAGADAQAYWETRRVDAINRQLGWNQLYRAKAAAYANSNTLFYQPYVPGGFGYFGSFGGPYLGGYAYGWPYARGRIFGYGFYDPVPQPIGRKEIQTGPNRWESFPIYAADVAKPAPPKVITPELPGTPKPAPVRGREF